MIDDWYNFLPYALHLKVGHVTNSNMALLVEQIRTVSGITTGLRIICSRRTGKFSRNGKLGINGAADGRRRNGRRGHDISDDRRRN